MKTICLITPPSCFLLDERVFVSLGILRVAAALERAGYRVELLDLAGIENYTEVVLDHAMRTEAECFGITATTPQMPAVVHIVQTLRTVRPDARLILGGPHVTLIPEDARLYFRDVYDHVIRINETIDNQRELLTTALEANLSLISVRQNEVMKQLGAWGAIIAVPTLIAGIYGMNFEFMPETHWRWAYPVVGGLMVGTCIALHVRFKRAGWL